ncbi:MAG TPA: group II intron reverse transcriptase/maturase [Bacillales bacterium]|nr:group II intron reverse transcriptase/maturase [Bacillales bacterium]
MVQQFNYPKSESELRILQDNLYLVAKTKIQHGEIPNFKGLLEIISSEAVILTAIHKIKANKGSQTPGVDDETMRDNILEQDYLKVIERVQKTLQQYKPSFIRRVYIPKPGKQEKRPLGIPTIFDRIIQECIKTVIEPILEAQFYKHSYGFRPMRDTHMAVSRVTDLTHKTGYHWIVEGDISKFFDKVNHTKLIKKLWHMGIRDRRVLMIIQEMLKAGIMGELKENPLGTPQGGIISPLLANVYLHSFDQWIAREWEEKTTRYSYANHGKKIRALKNSGRLKPAYLVRYADDWVLITDSKQNAEKWIRKISSYLDSNLRLTLSKEKTLITNIRVKPIHFLGFNYKVVKGKSRTGFITRTRPIPERLDLKITEIQKDIKAIKRMKDSKEELIHTINKINSKIRGVIQYYEIATWVNIDMHKYSQVIRYTAYKALKKYGGDWIPANQVNNLTSVHSEYTTKIPTIQYSGGLKIGITNLDFCKWKRNTSKNQNETPYSDTGRSIYRKRTRKKLPLARADDILNLHYSELIAQGKTNKLYNFEYFLNRAYAFNRDGGKCKVCAIQIWSPEDIHTHHVRPYLPMDEVNRVQNLATVHRKCHQAIHNNQCYRHLDRKVWKKIKDFREKLIRSC